MSNKFCKEHFYLQAFKNICSEFPVGKIDKNESPDFIINHANIKIGFEVTNIYTDISLKKEIETEYIHLINYCRLFFEEATDIRHLSISICYNIQTRVPLQRKKELARIVSKLLLSNLPKPYEHSNISFQTLNDYTFPLEISSILIFNLPSLKENIWDFSRGGFVDDNISQNIQSTINPKNVKYKSYKNNCDFCNLLIVADNFSPTGFVELNIDDQNYIYKSYFENTFLFLVFDNKFYKLNTTK